MSQKKKYVLMVFIGILIGIFLKLFILDVTKVSGTSMEPAIKNGSTVCINKLAYGIAKPFGDSLLCTWKEPQKGDIVVYIHNNKPVIKRVVAIEFEQISYSTENGYWLFVNDKKIPLTEPQYQRIKYDSFVPENTVLCIGDNYSNSVDSRDYGFVFVESIFGKILCR